MGYARLRGRFALAGRTHDGVKGRFVCCTCEASEGLGWATVKADDVRVL